jgi:hypothetical protein
MKSSSAIIALPPSAPQRRDDQLEYLPAALRSSRSSEARQLCRLRKLIETDLFEGLIWPTAQQLKGLE